MKIAHKFLQLFVILVCVCTLLLTGCSSLQVVTYPEAQQLPEGKLKSVIKQLSDHGPKITGEFINEIEFSKNGLTVFVTAESQREYPITIGPAYLPVFPAFWMDWFLGPFGDKTLKLDVGYFSKENYDLDPTQFVIVQNGNELKPSKISGSSLEYETSNWEFILKLRGIRNQSGAVVLPDIHFSRGTVWIFDIAP